VAQALEANIPLSCDFGLLRHAQPNLFRLFCKIGLIPDSGGTCVSHSPDWHGKSQRVGVVRGATLWREKSAGVGD